MSLNKAQIIGNVCADPEVRDVNGSKVASLRIATSEKYTDRNGQSHENTEFHNVVAWRNTAGLIEKYVHKGDKLYVEGKLTTRKYQSQGVDKSITEIVVEKIDFMGGRSSKPQEENESPALRELTAPETEDIPF